MKRRSTISLVAALAGALLFAGGAPAYASVSTSDAVLGKTAAERGIAETELPDLVAKHAIVMTPDGTVYYERAASERIKIASLTKVMTALVALENSSMDDVVTIDHAAATIGESSANLREGDQLPMSEALIGLMVSSGNDAAMAIAQTVGAKLDPTSGDPRQVFVDAMNARAEKLGLKDTHFTNPHGLDEDAWAGDMYSTPRDLIAIYAEAMKNEQFRAIEGSDRTDLNVTSADGSARTIPLHPLNKIRGKHGNTGGKTGTTNLAGKCFVGAFEREGAGEVYVAVFNSTEDDVRFADTVALADWYYGHLATVPFANTPTMHGDVPVMAEATCSDWSDKTASVTVADPTKTVQVFSLAGKIAQTVDLKTLSGSVEKGDAAGSITLSQDGEDVGSMELVTAEAVAGTNPFEWVMVRFDRVIRFFEGEPSMAESSVLNEAPDPLAFDSWGAEA